MKKAFTLCALLCAAFSASADDYTISWVSPDLTQPQAAWDQSTVLSVQLNQPWADADKVSGMWGIYYTIEDLNPASEDERLVVALGQICSSGVSCNISEDGLTYSINFPSDRTFYEGHQYQLTYAMYKMKSAFSGNEVLAEGTPITFAGATAGAKYSDITLAYVNPSICSAMNSNLATTLNIGSQSVKVGFSAPVATFSVRKFLGWMSFEDFPYTASDNMQEFEFTPTAGYDEGTYQIWAQDAEGNYVQGTKGSLQTGSYTELKYTAYEVPELTISQVDNTLEITSDADQFCIVKSGQTQGISVGKLTLPEPNITISADGKKAIVDLSTLTDGGTLSIPANYFQFSQVMRYTETDGSISALTRYYSCNAQTFDFTVTPSDPEQGDEGGEDTPSTDLTLKAGNYTVTALKNGEPYSFNFELVDMGNNFKCVGGDFDNLKIEKQNAGYKLLWGLTYDDNWIDADIPTVLDGDEWSGDYLLTLTETGFTMPRYDIGTFDWDGIPTVTANVTNVVATIATATSISTLNAAEKASIFMQDGKLYIQLGSQRYNAAGQLVK